MGNGWTDGESLFFHNSFLGSGWRPFPFFRQPAFPAGLGDQREVECRTTRWPTFPYILTTQPLLAGAIGRSKAVEVWGQGGLASHIVFSPQLAAIGRLLLTGAHARTYRALAYRAWAASTRGRARLHALKPPLSLFYVSLSAVRFRGPRGVTGRVRKGTNSVTLLRKRRQISPCRR